jgi:predicted Zn-dependent peptidase
MAAAIAVAIVVTVVIAAAAAIAARKHRGAMRPGVEVTELASGLRVASEFRPDVHGVALGSWIRVGSRDEDAHDAGVSHLLEHLLFRGTQRHDALTIAEAFDRFGSDLAASTSREETDLNARVLAAHLPEAIDIVGAMIVCPEFNDLEPEREVVLEELALYEDTPDDLVHDMLGETLFPEQAIGRPIAGTPATVQAIDAPMVRAHHERHYTGDQVVVAVAGPVAHAEVVALVGEAFSGLERGVSQKRTAAVPARGAVAFTDRDTEQTHIAIGGGGIGRRDERRFALAVLDQILGGGAASRFWQEIREQRGLVYSVYSYVTFYDEAGQVGLALGTRPENVEEALEVAAVEIRALAAGRFRDGEIERARDNLKARLLLNMDSTVARMSRLGRSLISDIPLMSDDEVARRIDEVTANDVRDLMLDLYDPSMLCVSGIGSDRAAFERGVARFQEPGGGAH